MFFTNPESTIFFWTRHMSFQTGQDRAPKFAGQVLPDETKSGLKFLNILHTK